MPPGRISQTMLKAPSEKGAFSLTVWLMKAVAMIDASKPVSAGDELKITADLSKARLYDSVSKLAIN